MKHLLHEHDLLQCASSKLYKPRKIILENVDLLCTIGRLLKKICLYIITLCYSFIFPEVSFDPTS